jgi:hypothetical protein
MKREFSRAPFPRAARAFAGFAFASLVPASALAQSIPVGDVSPTLDPSAAPSTSSSSAPARTAAPAPQPNVIVVGPDGKVTSTTPAAADSGYYVPGDQGMAPEPDDVHLGPTPELHVVRRGDTLWDISFYYFNDPWQWPKVWSYNPQITNPHWIYPGDLVRLLPRGMFEQAQVPAERVVEPETTARTEALPAPARRLQVGVKQTAFVERSDLEKSITIVGAVDEKQLLGQGDSVYLAYPDGKPPRVGERYMIYQPGQKVKDLGAYVRILGTLEVVSVKKDKRARGVILSANQEIERGAKVGPLVQTFKNVPPGAAEGGRAGRDRRDADARAADRRGGGRVRRPRQGLGPRGR